MPGFSAALSLHLSLAVSVSASAEAAAMRQVAARTLHQLVSNLLWTGKNGDARQDKSRRPFMSWLDREGGRGGVEGETKRESGRGALSLQSFVNYVFACSANVAFPPRAQRMAKTKAVSLSRPGGERRGAERRGGWLHGQTLAGLVQARAGPGWPEVCADIHYHNSQQLKTFMWLLLTATPRCPLPPPPSTSKAVQCVCVSV